jgi:VIT1/CCC1 family predicted Fe2+/Mn2+ transporter
MSQVETGLGGADSERAKSSEPHGGNGLKARLNWLRAGVLGANDGIISTAGLVIGVAAATTARGPVLTAGVAGLAAGAVSMALGEYVSVSSARDTEIALIAQEKAELAADPEGELAELAEAYHAKGLSPQTALKVAEELTEKDVIRAHLEVEFGLDADDLTNPWHAAIASALAFVIGAALPLVAVVVAPVASRIWVTFAAVLLALVVTGSVSAHLGGAGRLRAVARLVVGGALAMGATWGIGALLGATVVG